VVGEVYPLGPADQGDIFSIYYRKNSAAVVYGPVLPFRGSTIYQLNYFAKCTILRKTIEHLLKSYNADVH
jgi:hypothetical protein